jgi:hypothetical protein
MAHVDGALPVVPGHAFSTADVELRGSLKRRMSKNVVRTRDGQLDASWMVNGSWHASAQVENDWYRRWSFVPIQIIVVLADINIDDIDEDGLTLLSRRVGVRYCFGDAHVAWIRDLGLQVLPINGTGCRHCANRDITTAGGGT